VENPLQELYLSRRCLKATVCKQTVQRIKSLELYAVCTMVMISVRPINTFTATDELSRQLMCIVRCHWQVYLLFSTRNSAVHWHHSK